MRPGKFFCKKSAKTTLQPAKCLKEYEIFR